MFDPVPTPLELLGLAKAIEPGFPSAFLASSGVKDVVFAVIHDEIDRPKSGGSPRARITRTPS